jgi:hypothetical protein
MKKKADDRMHDLLLKQEKTDAKRQKAFENFKNRNRDIEEDGYNAFG